MEKDEEYFKGKKISVKLDSANKPFFYTIKEVKYIDKHILGFVDKFGEEKGVRLEDIIEVSEA